MNSEMQEMLIRALEWAQNEMSHDLDETGCCLRGCQACKAIAKNQQWLKWRNEGHDPVAAALARYKGEERKELK